jgi:hypothetical protein
MKRILLLIAAIGLAAGTLATPPASASGTTYRAPYAMGPVSDPEDDGGGEFTHSGVNPATGQVDILSLNIVPGAIGCAATGAFGYLRVIHDVTGPVSKVMFAYSGASLTQYAWLKLNVRGIVGGAEQYIGSKAVRGQMVHDSGTFVAELDKAPDLGSQMTIDFGIESGSACPNADGGRATFATVTVA